jgi:hypothetical protein
MNYNKVATALLVAFIVSLSTLASENPAKDKKSKETTEYHRGWIGGEYKLVRRHWNWFMSEEAVIAFPKSLPKTQNKGLLITALSTNTPAYLAGLREGDLILELDHVRISSLADFRRKIDKKEPGASLAAQVFRGEDVRDYDVTMGRETYRRQGDFAVSLLPIVREPNLKFNPSFSFVALGFTLDEGKRTELGSAEQVYRSECLNDRHPYDAHWRAWLGVLLAEHSHEILSQEIVSK